MYFRVALIVLAATFFLCSIQVQAQKRARSKPLGEQYDQAQKDLLQAVENYKDSLEKLLVFQEDDVKTAIDTLEHRKDLFRQKIIGDKEVEASEHAVENAKAHVKATQKEIAEADLLGKTAAGQSQLVRIKFPYPKVTLLRVLKLNALPLAEVKTAIENRGVSFRLTPEVELEFTSLGATRELLKAIGSNYREFR